MTKQQQLEAWADTCDGECYYCPKCDSSESWVTLNPYTAAHEPISGECLDCGHSVEVEQWVRCRGNCRKMIPADQSGSYCMCLECEQTMDAEV